ncbi:DUF4047 domain-containing protein [Rossellomorea aquimaris]|uniref:DUF4047 domain-containing protein n=1 Tax=Rossellomorea aquimaris TaxID=189382 RepID=A0A5D4U941_9BACI|nr:DUF4047 domain-containing protein [Rossellomorea aquimaris]TYS76909.1 DUF4047 domain-containing protein [Rossellomorea aquimaris]TYS83812.1 DUF4047 domain-containing protein [Rossellomorea aquimaris]
MKGRFSKIIIPGLLILNLSLTVHLMGETEASFSSQKPPETMTFSAAFVFPSTIKQLEKNARYHVREIEKLYRGYQELNLDEALLLKETLVSLDQELQRLYRELDGYYQQALKDPEEFNYVIKGIGRVDKLIVELDSSKRLSQLQSYIESLKEEFQQEPPKQVEEEKVEPLEPEAEVDQDFTGEGESEPVVIETESEPKTETTEEGVESTIENSETTIENNHEPGGGSL